MQGIYEYRRPEVSSETFTILTRNTAELGGNKAVGPLHCGGGGGEAEQEQ